MTVVVDTASVAPDERFALWAQVSSQVLEPKVVEAKGDEDASERSFSARLVRHQLGPLTLDHMRADASTAIRTPALIRAQDPDQFSLLLQLRGECFVTQDSRTATVRPGEFTSWQSSHPYTVGGDGPFEVLTVRIPSALLGSQANGLGRRTALRIDGAAPTASLVRRYLSEVALGLDTDGFDPACQGHLARGVLELLPTLYSITPVPRSPDALRAQIQEYIAAHLFEPDLSPRRIAHEHFISSSYLNKLFIGRGVRATIRDERLERCRRDLADPALRHESILSIALRWGFASASHFSNTFRAAYGESPRQFRASSPAGPS